jgi:hypothetical protein
VSCIARTLHALRDPRRQWVWYRYSLSNPRPTQAGIGEELGVSRETVCLWLTEVNALVRADCSQDCH